MESEFFNSKSSGEVLHQFLVGLIGGFTTYSGLAMHLVDRFQSDRWLEGGITLGISLGVGLAMLTLGVWGGRRWASFASRS